MPKEDVNHYAPPIFDTPSVYLIDNNIVNVATSEPHPGYTCATCRYYTVREVPTPNLTDKLGEDMYNQPPTTDGACVVYFPYCLLYNINHLHGCNHYTEKPIEEQFSDNAIVEEFNSYDGPVGR